MSQLRVLVTGGGRGIGRAIALRFARERANVVVAARTAKELDSVVAEIVAAGGRGNAAQLDLRDHGSIEAGIWRATEFLEGAIDVLVNNAGIFDVKPLAALDLASWQRMLEVNLTGPMLVTKECLEALRESGRGHVFNIASAAAKRGYSGNAAYCASKYGLRGFGDALREELRPSGIRVSTIYPGATNTSIFDKVPGDWDRSKMNTPEDVAEVVWRAWSSPKDSDLADVDVPPRK